MKNRDLWFPGILLFLLALLVWSGCSSTPETPTPSPQQASVSISPAVPEELQDALSACFNGIPRVFPAFYTAQSSNPDLDQSDVLLWWGDPQRYQDLQTEEPLSYKMMDLEISVLVHDQNPLDTIPRSNLQEVFAGTTDNWNALVDQAPGQDIEVWVLPEGHPAQVLFERVLMRGLPVTNSARVAPDLTSISRAVQQDQAAIGLSLGETSPDTKTISIQPPVDALRQPVLLIYPDPTPAYAADLTDCLIPDRD